MKRFFLIVSLVACVLFLSTSAFASWGVTFQTQSVSQGQAGVNETVTINSDLAMAAITIPMIVRSIDPGSFWVTPLPWWTSGSNNGGVAWSWANPGWCDQIQEVRTGLSLSPCTDAGDVGYDAVTPDHFVVNAMGTMLETAAPTGHMSLTLTFGVSGTPGQFEFDTACWSGALNAIFLIDENANDYGSVAFFTKGVITIMPNLCPDIPGTYSGTLNGAELSPLSATTTGYHDPDGDPAQYFKVSGPGTVNQNTGAWSWTPQCGDAGPYTVVVNVSDVPHGSTGCPNSITSFGGTVTALPVGPVCPANITVHWGDLASGTATATTTCTPVTFSSDDGHMAAGGAYSWQTPNNPCALGVFPVMVTATDVAQRSAQCPFTVTVTNTLPVCNVPDKTFLFTDGYTQALAPVITDPDSDPLTFSNLTIAPTPSVMPTLVAGVVTWSPAGADAGTYHLTVDASDGCQSVTCGWDLTVQFVQAYKISILDPAYVDPIDPADHYVHTLNGRNATVAVHMMRGFVNGSGALDFLICYDQSVLAFKYATKGAGIAGWEYFTYRYGPFGNACGGGCPSGYIRLIGIRDMNNGVTPPAGSEFVNGFVALLTFYVSEDRSLIGLCPRIGFCSIDCGDNTISDKSGNKLALPYTGQDDPQGYFITFGPDYDPEACLIAKPGHEAQRFIYFDPGFICIIPPPDDRGDINLNGIANEVADAVLFTNYFIYGPSVWDPIWFENQILATDINDDGHVTTVADLVYLIRIITGDAQPFPASGEGKLNPYAVGLNVTTEMVDGKMVVTTNSTSDLGAGYLVFRYTGLTINEPSTGTAMTVKSHAENGEFRVLVYSMSGNRVDAGVTELVSIPVEGNGAIELADAQFSDAHGALMTVDLHSKAVPTTFELMQNYPNPFNASTVIRFALPVASNWTLNVYNVAGQVVKTFGGNSEPGIQSVTWNSDVASGIYFYKLTADSFNSTKKMVLMK